MRDEDILNYVFDYDMCQSINDFSRVISSLTADVFMVMARKAACFFSFLKRHGRISFDGKLVTDRILDFDTTWLSGKSIVLIDDVVVSGTTIYSVIEKLNKANVQCIKVYVLGANKKFFNPDILEYTDSNCQIKNYLQAPYMLLSDAACMRACSNIVSTFVLDLLPYDVDFPKHEFISISNHLYNQLLSCSDWYSYDVSSDLQAENNIKNVTMLPSERIIKKFDNEVGIPVSKLGFFKIRFFARSNSKNTKYILNVVPYFLFNAITLEDILSIYECWLPEIPTKLNSNIAKVRVLQYILAEKLFKLWMNTLNSIVPNKVVKALNTSEFFLVFPEEIYPEVMRAIDSKLCCVRPLSTLNNPEQVEFNEDTFDSKIIDREDQTDNMAVLQTKLIEPFTSLYFNKEKESRQVVLKYGKKAFEMPEYHNIIDRLNHGYSYRTLIQLLNGYPDIYDKETTVSLFIDEAIDAGVIVPIIAEELSLSGSVFYFRAYRHGEDVPFGELQEKLCALLLSAYAKNGGNKILTKLRVEKMLVLFARIGLTQHIFKPSPQDSIYYKVNIKAYLQGNIATVQDSRSYRYLRHRSDAVWLSDVLVDKGIISMENDKIVGITDNIDIDVDDSTRGKVCAIGQTFAELYKNLETKTLPYVSDKDLVLFSTCMFPHDILNALAAELAIFENRWEFQRKHIGNLFNTNPAQVVSEMAANDMYKAINSGQAKFFNFMNKDAQRRINEIAQQLENSKINFIGTAWGQFWPDNRNWTPESIEPQLYNTILKEGKFLLVFNLLCRLLFLCCVDVSDTQTRQKYQKEIAEYQEKLKFTYFKNWKDIDKIIQFSERILKEQSLATKFDLQQCLKVWQLISDYTFFMSSLLSDVELLTDRHGKTYRIDRYIHSIHLMVPEELFSEIGSYFEDWFRAKDIEYQSFLIAVPTDIFPEQGIWFFLKRGSLNDFSQVLDRAYNRFPKMRGVQVFYKLSEDLRLKMAAGINTKHQFGRFSSYAYTNARSGFSCKELGNRQIFWIIEDSQSNAKELNNLASGRIENLSKVSEAVIPFQTVAAKQSIVFCYRKMSQLEKYRKDYLTMKKKCKLFVSYSDDSPEHVAKVQTIVERLRQEHFEVYFFEDEPFGTDMVRFMRNIEICDITLIIGTPEYRRKAYEIDKSGVSFEDRIIAGGFMSQDRNKFVPISFGDFKECIPAPFDTLKGMQIQNIDSQVLDKLVYGLINRYKINEK